MEITMIGIDHSKASIQEREKLSFTKAQAEETMAKWNKSGCLLLSTCNRTEFWVSGTHDPRELFGLLCREKNCNEETLWNLVVSREGRKAVSHLLQMTSGLKSRIFGEDQILSQVREALVLARSCGAEDIIIEKVFQTAIAAAKKVKTEVRTTAISPSAARNGLLIAEETFGSLQGLNCLVIGSGNIGKLTAGMLAEKGARVRITQRRRMHSGRQQDPISVDGCRVIDYEERFDEIDTYKLVISATTSPHYTVKAADLTECLFEDCLWIDLAVPRDIEPTVAELQGIRLIDMDQVGDYAQGEKQESFQEAMAVLYEFEKDLNQWFAFRNHIQTVKQISRLVGDDIDKRAIKSNDLAGAAEKAIEKLLFGLKETLPENRWNECFAALKQSAEKETLKR